jgi:hypothetical protein
MKKSIIIGAVVIALGLLIALGPQFLFKVCTAHSGAFPLCHWTAQAELGMGMLIAALGICLIVFTDPKTQIGLVIGILFASILVFGIPHALIGGCKTSTMACRKVAFPAITVEGIILLVFSIALVVYSEMKKPSAE